MDFSNYNYEKLNNHVKMLNSEKVSSIGKSQEGRELFLLKIGNGKKVIHINGSHHGLEWITSSLLMRFCLEFENTSLATFYIVPMLNPDGIYKKWQANANGVDLNHNYDAYFYEYKKKAVKKPGGSKFPGDAPLDQPETKALIDFIKEKEEIEYFLAFHAQGEEIYYDFLDIVPKNSLEIANKMAKVSGYKVAKPSYMSSLSGFKDYIILKYNKPAFTIEVGKGINPISFDQFDKIYNDIVRMIMQLCLI